MRIKIVNLPDWFIQGGLVMWPLLLLSILVVTITVERCWFWFILFMYNKPRDLNHCLTLIKAKQRQQASEVVSKQKDPALIMLSIGLCADPIDALISMEIEARKQLDKMNSGQSLLDTVVTLAPMLGILGTILGIIDSFQALSHAGIDRPTAVVGGISQALTSTAAGLCVAMLALIAYNLSRHLQYKQALRLEIVAHRYTQARRTNHIAKIVDNYPVESVLKT
jgi:biopolymer transport protein ExbB